MCSCCSVPGQCLFPGACLPCIKGFYQPLSGQQQCWPCNRGYYAKYTHCAHLVTGDSGACFVYFTGTTVLTVSLGVLCATPARLVPSTTTPEQTVARVAHQVCLCNGDNQNPPQSAFLTSRKNLLRHFSSAALRFPFLPSEFHLVCAVHAGKLLQVS